MSGDGERDEQAERLRFALEAAGLGAWDWDIPSGRVWWSNNLAAIQGVAPERFDGTFAGFLALVHPEDRDALRSAVKRAVAAGTSFEVEFRVVGDDGVLRWISGKGRVADFLGDAATRVLGIGADVTERKRSEERQRLLAEAGQILSASFDVATNVEEAVRLAVPVLADWCVVDLLEDDGGLHRAAIVHRDLSRQEDADELRRRYRVLEPGTSHTLWRVLESGRPWLDPHVEVARFEAQARDPHHLALLRRLGFAAEMVVPLIARGRVLGALTFVVADPGRRYSDEDLAFADEFARCCALALDNARLYRDAQLAEAASRASEARYRAIVETANEGIWLVDQDARTVYANERMAQMLGTTVADLGEHDLLSFVFPEDQASARERIGSNLVGNVEQFDFRFRRVDGSEVQVLACTSPMRNGEGRIVGALGMFTDITERRRAESMMRFLSAASVELARSLDLRTTLENLARLVVPTLADWCVIDVKTEDGFERLAVVHRDPALAPVAENLKRFSPDPTATAGVGRVLGTGEPAFHPYVPPELADATARFDPDLRELLRTLGLDSYIVVPLIAREQILGAISLIFSTSGRRYEAHHFDVAQVLARRAAMAIDNARLHRQAEDAIRYRDEFLAIAAHDLRSPLTVIQGRAQMLDRWVSRLDGQETERLSRGLHDIEATAARMSRLIADLQDLAVLQSERDLQLDRRPTDLVALVAEEAALIGPTAGNHELSIRAAADQLVALVDAARIGRVVANLLGNAIKYSPAGGEIVVEIGTERRRAEGEAQEGWAVLSVRDRGIGIPEQDLPRIFERFHRGANVIGRIPGSGLGLSGVRQIVEQHGGTIEVQSEEGAGSTFVVRLPLVRAGSIREDGAVLDGAGRS